MNLELKEIVPHCSLETSSARRAVLAEQMAAYEQSGGSVYKAAHGESGIVDVTMNYKDRQQVDRATADKFRRVRSQPKVG